MDALPSGAHETPRVVNVHEAKAGTPWARLMPLEPPPPQRIPGRLRSQGPLRNPDGLLEPMAANELACWESGALPSLLQADGFQPLPIVLRHGLRAGAYRQPHRDPQLASFPCHKFW